MRDCFEIFTEKPGDLLCCDATWPSNTAKYFISKELLAISKGYGGRLSDKFITEDCGYLSKLDFKPTKPKSLKIKQYNSQSSLSLFLLPQA